MNLAPRPDRALCGHHSLSRIMTFFEARPPAGYPSRTWNLDRLGSQPSALIHRCIVLNLKTFPRPSQALDDPPRLRVPIGSINMRLK
jgi:hypothetical protein